MNITLQVVQGRPAGKKLVFSRGEFYIGRGEECHIRPASEWVSRQHCVLRVRADVATIQDLGSRNGTLVNGERILREHRLWPGDLIQVGPLSFEVSLDGSATPIPGPVQPKNPAEAMGRPGPLGAAADATAAVSIESTEHHPVLPAEEVVGQP